jgi:hypothetical protein
MDSTKLRRYQEAYNGIVRKSIKTYMGQMGYN